MEQSVHAQCTRCGGSPPPTPGSFVTLYTFEGQPDGADPQASLIQDLEGNLYGTTKTGGSSNLGTVFKLDAIGIETILYSFTGAPDGANPVTALILDSAGNLYGTTESGGIIGGTCPGNNGCGVVFKVDATGKETVLYSFTGAADGWSPLGALVEDSLGNLYGTTVSGGAVGPGVVFKLDPNGKETVLHSFSGGSTDGANPSASVTLDDSGNIYGTTSSGGTLNCTTGGFNTPLRTIGCGTVFKLDSTAAESILYSFPGDSNSGAAFPNSRLARDAAGSLYGTTSAGGGHCYVIAMMPPQPNVDIFCGTVFKVDAMGSVTVLHTFRGQNDGASPRGDLVLDAAGNLYGTTYYGGTGNCVVEGTFGLPVDVGCGTIFKIDPAGNETVLYTFPSFADGSPNAGLLLDSAGNLYGTASGNSSSSGTVFRLRQSETFSLSVVLSGSGSGTVTSSPTGISCGSQCSATFVGGIAVTLTPAPASSSTFSGWSGACSGSADCTLTLAAAESVTATFAASDFSLSPESGNLTLQPASQVNDIIAISLPSGAFNSAIQFSCTVMGPAPTPTCGISPSSMTPGANPANTTLTISAPSGNAGLPTSIDWKFWWQAFAALVGLAIFAMTLVGGVKKHNWQAWALRGFILLLLGMQAGCGSNNSSTKGPLSYSVTVTGSANAGALQHSAQINVTMQ
jgi:uncharacterized repeat protein (TIGR03803 family)